MVIPEFESECKICHEVDTHYTRDCPQNVCFRCKQRGHWSTHCKCYICGETGRKANACQKQCEVCLKTGHKTEDCHHKDSGVTFIQNPMTKRVRDVSPPKRVQAKRRQRPIPNNLEEALKSESKTSKEDSGSNEENPANQTHSKKVKSLFKNPPKCVQAKRRQRPLPKNLEETPKLESKTSKEDYESNAESPGKLDAQQRIP